MSATNITQSSVSVIPTLDKHLCASTHGYAQPEPMGLEYIGGSLSEAGFNVVFCSGLEVEACLTGQGAKRISFISSTTSEWSAAVRIAERAKQRGNITVVGGYHATGMEWHDLDDVPFDYVVKGEGEHVCVALARVLLNGQMVDATLDGAKEVIANKFITARRIEDLDSLPFPLRSERFMAGVLCDLMWPPPSRQTNFALVIASRGCVYDCSFCASASMWGRNVRHRSPENVVAELRTLKEQLGTNTVVFVDQSLGQDRVWTLELCRAIKAERLGINWYPMCNMSIDRDILLAMANAGCTKIGFGVEGLSPYAVKRLKPQNPHDFDIANDLFGYCNTLGIFVKAFLMIGHPWETREIIQGYFEWLPRLRVNQIKLAYFTPFPGTTEWLRYHDQLASEQWENFDAFSLPVVKNSDISVELYDEFRRDLLRCFYESTTFIDVTRQMLEKYPHYIDSFSEFATFLREQGIVNIGLLEHLLSDLRGKPTAASRVCKTFEGNASCS